MTTEANALRLSQVMGRVGSRALVDRNIVCFGGEQWTYPGFQQVVMRGLSKKNRVLYVNALGLRKASINPRDLRAYLARLRRLFAGRVSVSETVMVANPFLIPLMYDRTVERINRWLLQRQFRALLSERGFSEYLLWAGTPTMAPYLAVLRPSFVVYNPVDRYSRFEFADRKAVERMERCLAARADLIIATADAIRDDMGEYSDKCHVVSHGVAFEHFNRAVAALETPHDLAGVRRPIIGFFGLISDWVNLGLIRKVAEKYPEATVLLIGRATRDLSVVTAAKNVTVLGFRAFDDLPAYLRALDVCLIPFHLSELVDGVDPIKLREYLCAGKPVVATNFREARKFGDLIYVGRDEAEFVAHVGQALAESSERLADRRIEAARSDDWPRKVQVIEEIVASAIEAHAAQAS